MKLLTLLLISVAGAFAGQAPSTAVLPPVPPSDSAVPAAVSIFQGQRVGPGDLLALSVADCPELTRNFRVAADGTLQLPLLRERIKVTGKEPVEIEMDIAGALRSNQVLVQPIVSAYVVEYRSIPVSVLGAVRHPITFQAVGNTTLMDALTKADGLAADAGPEILVSKARDSDGKIGQTLVQRIPVRGLIDGAIRV